MRVIVGCEFSQVVTRAFRDKGHEAYSCDLLPTEGNPAWHFQEDILELLKRERFDLAIFHPPRTDLAVNGAAWFKEKQADGRLWESINFFMKFVFAPIDKIAIENPVSIMSRIYRKPDQIIHPYFFGDEAQKTTCLWLKNLPLLKATNIVDGRLHRVHLEPPGPERWKNRSRTYQGIAEAMSSQWNF